jgi:ribosomal protein S18 acetylase RimI-like enzyme
MATHPNYRRQGAATTILGALANWGSDHGADQMYLQVMENNPPALALYARAGFEKLYQYYYAEGPVE